MKYKFISFFKSNFSKKLILMALLLPMLPLHAADIVEAKVVGVRCADDQYHYCAIYFNKKWTGTIDGCAQTIPNDYIMYLDNSTTGGNAMLGVALTANAKNKTVVANSKSTCNIVPGGADLNYLMIAPKCADSFNTWGCEP